MAGVRVRSHGRLPGSPLVQRWEACSWHCHWAPEPSPRVRHPAKMSCRSLAASLAAVGSPNRRGTPEFPQAGQMSPFGAQDPHSPHCVRSVCPDGPITPHPARALCGRSTAAPPRLGFGRTLNCASGHASKSARGAVGRGGWIRSGGWPPPVSLAGSDQLHVGETRMWAGADQCEVDSGRPAGISTVGFPEPPSCRRAGHPGTGLSASPVRGRRAGLSAGWPWCRDGCSR